MPPLILRRWAPSDLEAMERAVAESLDHLRPWMPWAANEPLSREARAGLLDTFARQWETGEAFGYALLLDDVVVGGFGLEARIGEGGLEIGYWIHVAWTGRGLATLATRALTDAALALPGVDRVEIHHDKANTASRRIPEKLGYVLVAEVPDEVAAPAESGIECQWRVTTARVR